MAVSAPVTSINNFLLSDFTKSFHCVNQKCVLSHKLAEIDKKNFGQQYSEPIKSTNIFPRICVNCLLSKFGLYESTHKETLTYMNCISKSTKGRDDNDRIEGPYLRAFKMVKNIIPNEQVVFNANTIILPAGKLFLDLIMSDSDILFNNNKNIPTITIEVITNQISKILKFEINPYLYSYFKHLYDRLTLPDDKKNTFREYKYLEDLLCLDQKFETDCLDATFEIDAMLISNLINPIASLSHYVSKAEVVNISKNKNLNITLDEIICKEIPKEAEKADTADNAYGKFNFKNENFTADIITNPLKCVTKEKLQHFNSIMFSYVAGMRQLIVNRQLGLANYFTWDNNRDICSASGLHVSSFCLPHEITENNKVYRKFSPNVIWVESIGLVAAVDICQNEILVINRSTLLSNFIRLKMSNYEQSIQYSELELDLNTFKRDKLSYEYEGRKPRQPKMCLYAKT